MSSTFFGFNISLTGLMTSQRQLYVTSHNTANVNTPGYTRQRADVVQTSPQYVAGVGVVGTGVTTETITQLRNEFLDYQYRGEYSKLGTAAGEADVLTNIEAIFNEPSESGIRTVTDEFFSALQELNKNADSLTTRALVRQKGIALTKNLQSLSSSLTKLQSDVNFQIQTNVDKINQIGENIASLNDQIKAFEMDGKSVANDLRDQRNLLLDELSGYVEIDYFEDSEERLYVNINGQSLVSHNRSQKISAEARSSRENYEDAELMVDLSWENGSTFNPTGGKVKGLLDMRDGEDGAAKGIPYYQQKLNEFTDTLTESLNAIQKTGYGLDKSTGNNMFTIDGMSTVEYETYLKNKGLNGGPGVDVTAATLNGTSDDKTEEENEAIIKANKAQILKDMGYENKSIKLMSDGTYLVTDRMSAARVTLAKDVDDDLDKFAAAKSLEGLSGEGTNALKMNKIRHDQSLYEWGSPDDFMKSLISNLGVDSQSSQRNVSNQEVLANKVQYDRLAISSVSMDEEMSNMVKFQSSYNANAKMLTTMDEMIQTLIGLKR